MTHAPLTVVNVDDLDWHQSFDAIIERLGGPSLVRVPGALGPTSGATQRARLISGSLHGNEPSGARALQALLRRLRESATTPPVDLLLVFGALDAALLEPRFRTRMRPGQRDLNRCFRGPFDDDNGRVAAAILAATDNVELDAVLDVHNTSGNNPDFVIVGVEDAVHTALASSFSSRLLAWRLQLGTLAEVFEGRCPALTLEAGTAHSAAADAIAADAVWRFATMQNIEAPPSSSTPTMYRDPMRVRLRPDVTIAFGDAAASAADVVCDADVDRSNFVDVAAGTVIATVRGGYEGLPFVVDGGDLRSGPDLADRLFVRVGDSVRTTTTLVPMMMTTNADVARSDCLMYAVLP